MEMEIYDDSFAKEDHLFFLHFGGSCERVLWHQMLEEWIKIKM